MALGFQASPPRTLSIQIKASALDQVVAQIANATGLKMRVNAEMHREIVLVSVRDAPVRDVLAKLAKVSSGVWINDSGTYVLAVDGSKRQAQAQAEVNERVRAIRDLLEKMTAAAPKETRPIPPDEAEQNQLFKEVESERTLLNAAISQLDPTQIAGMQDNSRLVFSTNPNAMQLPLTLPRDLVEKFIEEHNAEGEKIRKFMKSKSEDPEIQSMLPALTDRFKPISAAPGKVLLVVTFDDSGHTLLVELEIFDSKGAVLYRTSTNASMDEQENMFGIPEDLPELSSDSRSKPLPKGKPVDFTPASKELLKLFMSHGPTPTVSPSTLKALSHPETNDPLSFIVSDALISTGAARGEQVIADIPDDAVMAFAFAAKTSADTSAFLNALQTLASRFSVSEADGWLIVRPAKPSSATEHRMDRDALSNLIGAARTNGDVSLNDWAAYASRVEKPTLNSANLLYFILFIPGMLEQESTVDQWLAFRLLATMSESQRSSNQIPFRSLSDAQLAIVSEMVFGARTRLRVQRAREPQGAPGNQPPRRVRDFKNEPTEVCPSGLPSNGDIEIAREFRPVVKMAEPSTELWMLAGAMDAKAYASLAGDPSFLQNDKPKTALLRLKVGKRVNISLKLVLTSDVSVVISMHEDWFATDAPVVASKDLPDEFTKAVADEVRLRKEAASERDRESLPPPR